MRCLRRSGSCRTVLLLGLLTLASPVSGGALSLAQVDKDFAEAAGVLVRATVLIRGEGAPEGMLGSSGVVIHPDGYVLSDADATLIQVQPGIGPPQKTHAGKATVRFPDGKVYPATVVKRDEATDSSLLRIDAKGVTFKALPLGSSDEVGVGSWAMLCGNAFGTANEGRPAAALGVISAIHLGTLYTSAAVNPGSNGGPCADAEGRLVGIVSTWEAQPSAPLYGFGRVTPLNRIRRRYQELPEFDRLFPDPKTLPPRARSAAVLEEAFRILARRVYPSVVSIAFKRSPGADRTEIVVTPQGKQVPLPCYGGPASGLLYDREGHVLTALSNLWGFERITGTTVHLPDGRDLPARILARDRVRGLALLKVEATGLPCLEPASDDGVRVGQFAFALGNPWGRKQEPAPLFTFGIVSALHQLDKRRDALQTDAGMNDANAGGPLVDLQGRLLGLNTLQSPERFGRNSGIGFAVPPAAIAEVLPRMKEGRDVLPGSLGVALAETTDGKVTIQDVVPGSPAENAGLAAGDIVTTLNGQAIGSAAQIVDLIGAMQAGDLAEVEGVRGGAPLKIPVTLGERTER